MSKRDEANWQHANRTKDNVLVGGWGSKGMSVACCYRHCVDYLTALLQLLNSKHRNNKKCFQHLP